MLTVLFIIFGLYVCIIFPIIPVFIFNLPFVVWYIFKDTFMYIKREGWKEFKKYGIKVFVGMFGHGKTLSSSHYAHKLYKKYGDDLLFIANYKLKNMPYTPLVSFEQLVEVQELRQAIEVLKDKVNKYEYRLKNGAELFIIEQKHYKKIKSELNQKQTEFPYKGVVVCISEIELLLNNRKYADFPIELLHTLCQQRKFKMYCMVDAQRFGMIDIAFRRISTWVDDCHKLWRFQCNKVYDAWDMENAINPQYVKPLRRYCFFVRDKDYNGYDTTESVTRYNSADFISNKESLERKGYTLADLSIVGKKTHKAKSLINHKI